MSSPLQRIERIFHRALTVPSSERAAFLERECGADAELIREIESLLRHEGGDTGDFTAAARPVAAELVGRLRANSGFAPGAALGRYRIERKLGEGGMGAVYLGTDTRLGRNVAIKLVSSTLAHTPEARARFLRETRSAAALAHANIAAIFDAGENDGTLWLVMEHVKGATLRSRLAGPLREAEWRRYAAELAAALEHAHARGIIHRDIKPENILITEENHVKVIDFGLARAASETTPTGTAITEQNAFIGTLAYAAPELLNGGEASTRSDVYSLGVVLYEMACGQQPFVGLAGPGLVSAILAGAYTVCSSKNPSVPQDIAGVIERCLATNAADRYKSGGAVAAALRETGSSREIIRVPEPPAIAVMNFTRIGGDDGTEWLGAGIAETLSADLSKLKSVRVANRGRVAQAMRQLGIDYLDASAAARLACHLGARWIVTGAYQQIGERVRVTVNLVDADGGETISMEKIDGRWADLFEVQDRVVAAILNALTIGFGTTDQQKIMPPETRSMVAYEHYVRGRQQLYRMDTAALSLAIHCFEQAVALDSSYALAYSGLGAAHALRFIVSSSPEDVASASRYLEHAIELDPELGEPYPWLANIRVRRNDPAGAVAAGRRGIELQPDLAEAHYFFAGVHYMVPEFEPGAMRNTPLHLATCLHLQPRLHAAWLVYGATAAFVGKHQEAIRILRRGVQVEADPAVAYRFVGLETLLGLVQARNGDWDASHAQHLEALEHLRDAEHLYAPGFRALSACGLGEVELRRGDPAGAAAHFRHARRIIAESRRMVGSARLMVRANAGLAAAYAAAGNRARAKELTMESAQQMESLGQQSATVMFECSLAQLCLCLAVAETRLGSIGSAAEHLLGARRFGWLDLSYLRIDPELRPLHHDAAFVDFVRELESAPDIEIPLPSMTGGSHSSLGPS